MGTIVQEYGPIYGEAVNGTVQGRPNGSIFVPLFNTITFTPDVDSGFKVVNSEEPGRYRCSFVKAAIYVAEAQDIASYIQQQIYSDAECTTLLAYRNNAAGSFNLSLFRCTLPFDDASIFEVGETYYCRAQLMASTNVPIATSDVYALECVSNVGE